jgi:hypothetical protein
MEGIGIHWRILKWNLKEWGWKIVNWSHLAEDRD